MVDRLKWLVGPWTDGAVEERWFAPVAGRMIGVNRNLETGFFEFLRIESRKTGPVYIASPMGGVATEFMAVVVEADHVHFRNPDHDFPTDIEYRLADGELGARVWAGARLATWRWRRAHH